MTTAHKIPKSEVEDAKRSLYRDLAGCACTVCHCQKFQAIHLAHKEVKGLKGGGYQISKKTYTREKNARRWAIISLPAHTGD